MGRCFEIRLFAILLQYIPTVAGRTDGDKAPFGRSRSSKSSGKQSVFRRQCAQCERRRPRGRQYTPCPSTDELLDPTLPAHPWDVHTQCLSLFLISASSDTPSSFSVVSFVPESMAAAFQTSNIPTSLSINLNIIC